MFDLTRPPLLFFKRSEISQNTTARCQRCEALSEEIENLKNQLEKAVSLHHQEEAIPVPMVQSRQELSFGLISELRHLKRPPEPVQKVLQAFSALFGEKTLKDPFLISKMRQLKENSVTQETWCKVDEILANVKPERISQCSKSAKVLFDWIACLRIQDQIR